MLYQLGLMFFKNHPHFNRSAPSLLWIHQRPKLQRRTQATEAFLSRLLCQAIRLASLRVGSTCSIISSTG